MVCRLVNKSGLRLTYWTVSDSGQGSAYVLNAWEESLLMVEPVQKPVILTDTQQQVTSLRLTVLSGLHMRGHIHHCWTSL